MASITTTRLTGLSSGLDTDSIIKNMMQLEQLKVDRQLRSKTTLQWKQAALTSVASDLRTFRETYMSTLSPQTNLLSENAFKKYNVTTGDTSGAVTLTAKSGATVGTVRVNKVEQLAVNAVAKSDKSVSGDNADAIAPNNTYRLSELNLANDLQFDSNGKISFTVNDVRFEFSKDDTLQHMLSTVSSNEDANVTFTYSRLTDAFSLTSKRGGTDGDVTFENIAGNMFGQNSATGITKTQAGQNAVFYVNGERVEKNSNTVDADGFIFTLNAETENTITFNIAHDVEGVVEKIKGFVTGYNTMISKLEGLLSERKSNSEKGYVALTDEEKGTMTEEQIKDWELIAKKGLLYNDAGIRGLVGELRGALYSVVEGTGLSPADIGLRTGNWGKGGQIDEDTYEDAIREWVTKDIDSVMSVFTRKSSSDDPAVAAKENGLLNRIWTIFDNYTKGSSSTSIESIESSISKLTTKIETMETRMADLEERYYLKYAAMETALSKLQNQSSWISQMLGTGN